MVFFVFIDYPLALIAAIRRAVRKAGIRYQKMPKSFAS